MAKRRGIKICPSCQKENGARSYRCNGEGCNHVFIQGEPKATVYIPTGAGRGQKICPSCKGMTGPRSFSCPHCEYQFKPGATKTKVAAAPVKIKSKKRVLDWKTLEVGSRIRVIRGSGDHYIDKNGEKIYMQQTGAYYVQKVESEGIIVTSKSGHGYIYMGESKVSKISKMIQKERHSLLLMSGKNEL